MKKLLASLFGSSKSNTVKATQPTGATINYTQMLNAFNAGKDLQDLYSTYR